MTSVGFVGRFLTRYIHDNQLASTYRIVDKVLPQLAHLAPEFKEACSNKHFLQADASREASMSRIFEHPDGSDATWDYVINLGGETSFSQTAEIYKLRNTQLSATLGKEAAKRGVKAFVEVSTGSVYACSRVPRVESDKLKPWNKISRSKLQAEEELSKIPGLNLVILRVAHVYGEYNTSFIGKVMCLARVYQEQQRDLKWLWTGETRQNGVYVEDLVRALWTAAEWRSQNASVENVNSGKEKGTVSKEDTNVPIFNIVDHGDSTQGTYAKIIATVFGIKTGFHGTLISQFARLNMNSVIDDLNDELLQPWAEMLEAKGMTPGPLGPFLEKDLLKDNDMCLNGSLFERVTGFEYKCLPGGIDEETFKKVIASYERMNWWP